MSGEVSFKYKFQKSQSVYEETYIKFMALAFKWMNWISELAVVVFTFFTGTNRIDIDMYDMAKHCNEEWFNLTPIPMSKLLLIGNIIALTTFLLFFVSSRMLFYGKLIEDDFQNFVNFVTGILVCLIVCSVLQNMIGYPYPEFFVNQKLKWYYCCTNCPNAELTEELKKINLVLRGSFPSTYICVSCYLTAYLFFFGYYLDIAKSFAAKISLPLVPGFVTLYYGVLLWKNNHYHLHDIIGGSIIGIGIAVFTSLDLFTKNNSSKEFQNNCTTIVMTREINNVLNNPIERTSEDNEYIINLFPMELMELQPLNCCAPKNNLEPSQSSTYC